MTCRFGTATLQSGGDAQESRGTDAAPGRPCCENWAVLSQDVVLVVSAAVVVVQCARDRSGKVHVLVTRQSSLSG